MPGLSEVFGDNGNQPADDANYVEVTEVPGEDGSSTTVTGPGNDYEPGGNDDSPVGNGDDPTSSDMQADYMTYDV